LYKKEKGHLEEIVKLIGHDNYIFSGLSLLTKPHFYFKAGTAPAHQDNMSARLASADSFILVSAEYNHCIPPALSNLLDHFGCSKYAYRPSGIVTYSAGPWGGMRAAMQLRALTGELGCISVSRIAGYARAQELFTTDGTWKGAQADGALDGLVNQLEWTAVALKVQRESVGIPK